jgi:thiamine-phosphate pyrophosphorylase
MSTRPSRHFPSGVYALCDDAIHPEVPLLTQVEAALAGGATTLQLRMKRTALAQAVEIAAAAKDACRRAGALCLVNDRPDVALLAGADGVHVGEEDIPPAAARQILGARAWIGATVRGVEGARAAAAQGADYVGLGPIFVTRTKQVAVPPLGLARLAEVAKESPLPVVAIAGIDLSNIADVAKAGARAAAVLGAMWGPLGIAASVAELVRSFEEGAR